MSQPPLFNPDHFVQILQQLGLIRPDPQVPNHPTTAAPLTPEGSGWFDHTPQLGPPGGAPPPAPPHSSPTPTSSSSATASLQSMPPVQAPDLSASLWRYETGTPTLVGPIYSSAHTGLSASSTINPTASTSPSVAFGSHPNPIAGYPPQYPTLHPAPFATVMTSSSRFPPVSSARPRTSQQGATAKHRPSIPRFRSQAHMRARGSGLGTNPTMEVIAILYPTAPGFRDDDNEFFNGEVVLHQNRRLAFRDRAAHLGLAVTLRVNLDTDDLLSVLRHVRQALESGPGQFRFVGLDDLLANATTNYDRLPFRLMSSCRRGYTRMDGNIYHKPHMVPLSDADMPMVNYINHKDLARPKRIYWEDNKFLMYLMSKVPVDGHIPPFNDQVPHRCLMARLTCGLETDQDVEQLQQATQPWSDRGGELTSESENEVEEASVLTPDTLTGLTAISPSSTPHAFLATPVDPTSASLSSGTSGPWRCSTASSSSALAPGSSGVPSPLSLPSSPNPSTMAMPQPRFGPARGSPFTSSHQSSIPGPDISSLTFGPGILFTPSHQDLSSIPELDDQIPTGMPAAYLQTEPNPPSQISSELQPEIPGSASSVEDVGQRFDMLEVQERPLENE